MIVGLFGAVVPEIVASSEKIHAWIFCLEPFWTHNSRNVSLKQKDSCMNLSIGGLFWGPGSRNFRLKQKDSCMNLLFWSL